MSIDRLDSPESKWLEQYNPLTLVPHFPRLRAIREHYGRLEEAKYGRSWSAIEILDGEKGDIGDLSKLETGRRGLRDGYSPEALEHELVDCVWSRVVSADSNGIDPVRACTLAGERGPLVLDTPRQLINRLTLAVVCTDEVTDPSHEPLVAVDREYFVDYYAEAFRTLASLAQAYEIDVPQAIATNMDELEHRIRAEIDEVKE